MMNKSLIINNFLGMMLIQVSVGASSLCEDNKPAQCKIQTSQKSASQPFKKNLGNKRTFSKRDSQQSITQFFDISKKSKLAKTTASNTSFSSGTITSIDLTIDETDKENDPSPMREQTSSSKSTLEEIAAFNKLFSPIKSANIAHKKAVKPLSPLQAQTSKSSPEELKRFTKLFSQPTKVDYEAIKARKLKEIGNLSQNGNPVMHFSSCESPDHIAHQIVITHWINPKDPSEIKFSAYIDGTSLGHWFTDQDSVKRAAINKIYNNK